MARRGDAKSIPEDEQEVNVMSAKQQIFCDVNNCRFNCEGKNCTLDSIQVGCCCHDEATRQGDSMCCSFREQV